MKVEGASLCILYGLGYASIRLDEVHVFDITKEISNLHVYRTWKCDGDTRNSLLYGKPW